MNGFNDIIKDIDEMLGLEGKRVWDRERYGVKDLKKWKVMREREDEKRRWVRVWNAVDGEDGKDVLKVKKSVRHVRFD